MLGYQHELSATNQGLSYEKNVFGPAVRPIPFPLTGCAPC